MSPRSRDRLPSWDAMHGGLDAGDRRPRGPENSRLKTERGGRMKRLLVLWDPGNPLTPVGPVLSSLLEHADASECTFRDVAHRTLPNRTFKIAPHIDRMKFDGLLWIEGGPLPDDLASVRCPKACWLTSAHLEPTLLEDVGPAFDLRLVSNLELCADENA